MHLLISSFIQLVMQKIAFALDKTNIIIHTVKEKTAQISAALDDIMFLIGCRVILNIYSAIYTRRTAVKRTLLIEMMYLHALITENVE